MQCLILAGGLVIWGLIWTVDKTSFGAKVRAAVDGYRAAQTEKVTKTQLPSGAAR